MKRIILLMLSIFLLFSSCIENKVEDAPKEEKGKESFVKTDYSIGGARGEYILYGHQTVKGEVCMVDLRDGKNTGIYEGEYADAMAAGEKVLFYSKQNNERGIYSIDANNRLLKLVSEDYRPREKPAVSPNGELVAFAGFYKYQYDLQVYCMRTFDFIPQKLEINGDIEYLSFWGNDTLLYSKRVKVDGKSVFQIFKYSLKDKKEERVLASQFNDVSAVISPDGKRIAFLSDRKVDYNLYLYDLDKKVVEQMDIKDGIKGGSLSWSKDGSYIAYIVLSGSAKYYVKLANAEKRTVWDLGEGYNVCFSPDGKYACYATYDIKNRKQVIYKMNLKEQKEEKIYEFPEQSVYSRSINMLCWIDG